MKKFIILFVAFVGSLSLFAQEPLVKFYMQDGTTKQYNIADIDSIGVIDKKNNYVMKIHYLDTLVDYYPTEIIGSIKFEKDTLNRQVLNVYIFTYPKSYLLHTIDSIIFYIDQWQPLTIGEQVWMLKNLNVDHYRNGDTIPEVTGHYIWGGLTTGAWCYYNNSDSLGKIYGKLYNWFAVGDTRGLAPSGWHIPSIYEWSELVSFLGFNIAGGKMKEVGTSHWISPNTGATNESGFSALPGGWRTEQGYANFTEIGYMGSWHSTYSRSSETQASYLSNIFKTSASGVRSKDCGFSVRCVKDK